MQLRSIPTLRAPLSAATIEGSAPPAPSSKTFIPSQIAPRAKSRMWPNVLAEFQLHSQKLAIDTRQEGTNKPTRNVHTGSDPKGGAIRRPLCRLIPRSRY